MMMLLLGRLARRQRAALLVLCGFFLSGLSMAPAHAENLCVGGGSDNSVGNDEFKSCWYLGAGMGATMVHPEGEADGWHTVDDSSDGVKLYAGFLFKPHWFAELAYTDAGAATLGNRDPSVTGSPELNYNIPSFFIGYLLHEPAADWNFYVKAGNSAINNEVDDSRVPFDKKTSVQAAFGVGAQHRFGDRWFLRLEHDSFDRDANYTGLSIGAYLGSRAERLQQSAQAPTESAAPSIDCTAFTGTIEGVQFLSNSAQLTAAAERTLAGIAVNLKSFSGLQLEIQAHTDSQGNDTYNMTLSEQRARSVVNFLVSQGIAAERLTARGYGETRAVASNYTADGRAKNRRVEFKVLGDSDCASQTPKAP
jgi:outer membrane protein OmpA-like peptidoglycan-associated protein